jgi:hypothetical protein
MQCGGEEDVMTRGRPFEPGNKNGRGRPKGSKNQSPSVRRGILKDCEEQLIRKNIAEGLRNNTRSRQACLDELSRGTPQSSKLRLPAIRTLDDVAVAYDIVLQAVANLKCTDAHGQALCAMLALRRKMIEDEQLAQLDLEDLRKLGSK